MWALAERPVPRARPEPTSIHADTHTAPRRQAEPRHTHPGPRPPGAHRFRQNHLEWCPRSTHKSLHTGPEKTGSHIWASRLTGHVGTCPHTNTDTHEQTGPHAYPSEHKGTHPRGQTHTHAPTSAPKTHVHPWGLQVSILTGHCGIWLVKITVNRETSRF